MIISVYGIPRSGKDTFINEVLDKSNSIHIKGSESLNKLSKEKYGCKFRMLDSNKQNEIRIEFANEVKQKNNDYDLIIVDGHYAFPEGNSFKSVFTQADLDLYDAFFYLKRTGSEIIRNFNNGDRKDYSTYLLDTVKSEEWMDYEIKNMKRIVEASDKDFIVLDSNPNSVDFVSNFNKTSKDIAKDIVNDILNTNYQNIILSDLDKTLSINDLTNDFIQNSNLDHTFPKAVFKGDYYTQYQFYLFHNFLKSSKNYEESIKYAVSKIELNKLLISNILSIKDDCLVVGITTGIVPAWNIINKDINVLDKIYGFDDNIIITPLVKALVSKYLKNTRKVIGIGDSIIDLGMLENANKGYLVSMLKLDKRIIKEYSEYGIPNSIKQLDYSLYKYDFLKEDTLKW